MKKKEKDSKPLLPAKAPKKSGKRGVGPKPDPIDPVADFETPAKQELQGSALPESAKKPRQARLPTMEDAQIEELETAAEEYAEYRDKRIALTVDEVACKKDLLALMQKHSKMKYQHNGYLIERTVESEKLKVKIKKEE